MTVKPSLETTQITFSRCPLPHLAPSARTLFLSMRACLRMGSCLYALMRRKPFCASNIPAEVQRKAIFASRQRFISADAADNAVHGFNDIGTGLRRNSNAKSDDSQDFIDAFEDRFRHIRRFHLQPPRQIAHQALSLVGVIQFPCLLQSTSHSCVMLRVEPVGNVASLVDLATLNGDVCAEGTLGLGERFGTVHGPPDQGRAQSGYRAGPAR